MGRACAPRERQSRPVTDSRRRAAALASSRSFPSRVLRLPARLALAALLLAGVAAGLPDEARSQTSCPDTAPAGAVWSACLTVAAVRLNAENVLGYIGSRGRLSPGSFTYGGSSIEVFRLFYSTETDGKLTFFIGAALGSGNFDLHLGSVKIDIDDPGNTVLHEISNHGLSWSSGQKVSVHLVAPDDASVPELDSAAVDGKELTLTFDENLKASSKPAATAFTVKVTNGGTQRTTTVTEVDSISGAEVELTLAEAVIAGETVTVSYAKPSANPLEDTYGNDVASFTDKAVGTNTSPACPGGQPSDAIWSACLTVGKTGSGANTIRGFGSGHGDLSDTEFTLDGVTYEIDGLLDAPALGKYLSFAAEPRPGANGLTVHVGDASAKLQSILNYESSTHSYRVANALFDWSDANVGDKISVSLRDTRLRFGSAAVDAKELALTFNENLSTSSKPAASAFTVKVTDSGSTERETDVSAVAISGAVVTLTLAEAVIAGETVTVSYVKPNTNPLKSSATNDDVDSFTDEDVTNTSPACPDTGSEPADTIWSACVTVGKTGSGGTALRGFGTGYGALSDNSFTHDGTSYVIDAIQDGQPGLIISFAADPRPAAAGWALEVGDRSVALGDMTYVAGHNGYQWAGTPSRWSDGNVGDKVTVRLRDASPKLSSAAVTSKTLTLTFDETLNTSSEPAASAFTVEVAESTADLAGSPDEIDVRSVDMSGAVVTLTLREAVIGGQAVQVSYEKPGTNPLEDGDGYDVASFDDEAVTNNSPACPAASLPAGTFWSACLTVGRVTNGNFPGFSTDTSTPYGELSDKRFTLDGTTYTIDTLTTNISRNQAFLSFTANPGSAADRWVLQVGGRSLALEDRDAYISNRRTFRWDSAGFRWRSGNVGDKVTVSLRVDPPKVTDVDITSTPASGTSTPKKYGEGEKIEFTVTFNEAMTVTGTPELRISVGDGSDRAVYVSGSGSDDLVFEYTVQSGDTDDNGVFVFNDPVVLESGELIRTGDGDDAHLDYDFPDGDDGHTRSGRRFSGHQVDGSLTPPGPPKLSSAAVTSKKLNLIFNEALVTSSKPVASAFTVSVAEDRLDLAAGGDEIDVSDVQIRGPLVSLTLAEAVIGGQLVQVAYSKPDTNPLEDSDGDEVANFSEEVTNKSPACPATDLPAETFWSACLTVGEDRAQGWGYSSAAGALTSNSFDRGGTTHQIDTVITDTSLALVFASNPGAAANGWVFQVGGDSYALSAATFDSATDTYEWSSPATSWDGDDVGDKVTVSLRSADSTAPEFSAAEINWNRLSVAFNEALKADSKPGTGAFTVKVNGTAVTLSKVSVGGRFAALDLAAGVESTDVVTVTYTAPGSDPRLQDDAGNPVATFTDKPVTNNTPVCPSGQPADAFWTACMTIGENGAGTRFGYAAGYGTLAPSRATFGAATHDIDLLDYQSGSQTFSLSFAADPGAAANHWVLQ